LNIPFPQQRWKIAQPDRLQVRHLAQQIGLKPLLAQVLINRGVTTPELAQVYCNPEKQNLPDPRTEFADLNSSVECLTTAIATGAKIAICGDYDADGMTSTALLLRALGYLGANIEYAIPSRMKDGYGINERIVREFAQSGVQLILTVDNGISAYGAIALAVELGLEVIITDHHDLPAQLPPAQGILNPKLLPLGSPYRGLAGVGVAYILAVATAQKMGRLRGLTEQLLELYTLGTIADLAPLVGVNRRWLKRGLKRLCQSQILGVQALIQVTGVNHQQNSLRPDDIGFRLGPRINAVGRLGDPQVVIELLTTTDPDVAHQRALECEAINKQRQDLCQHIEEEAVNLIQNSGLPWRENRVLVLIHPQWHPGVIGIVASRLVERYGVPVFIGTITEDGLSVRGSARSIDEFNVFESLVYCQDLLSHFGGHQAAGGFSFPLSHLGQFQQRLRDFAHQCLKPEHLKPLLKIDGEAQFSELTFELLKTIESLQPWGIGNDFPLFWSRNIRLKEQKLIGQKHLRLELADPSDQIHLTAIAWRWGDYLPLPSPVDIAYKLQENRFQGRVSLQLELVGIRLGNNHSLHSQIF
jgi:single-stranded-DNA-specific exonuclease